MGNIFDISILAVLAGAFAYFLLGALWFTPLFGKFYDKSLGFDRPAGYKWQPIFYWMPLVSSIVTAGMLAWLSEALQPSTLGASLLIGLVVGLAGLSVSFNNAVTPNKPGPLMHGAVTGFYHLVASLLASGIIFALY